MLRNVNPTSIVTMSRSSSISGDEREPKQYRPAMRGADMGGRNRQHQLPAVRVRTERGRLRTRAGMFVCNMLSACLRPAAIVILLLAPGLVHAAAKKYEAEVAGNTLSGTAAVS